MRISVNVNLDKDETLAYTPDAAAMQVLVALGGNASEDFCELYVHTSAEPGTAGPPPPLETP
jgi:hypothetical protein